MKTTITKKLLGLALSVFSVTALAQCPTLLTMSVALGTNGTATITPVLSGAVSPSQTMYYWSVMPSATQTSGIFQSNGTFQFPTNGTYTLVTSINDSLSGCQINGSIVVTISNMAPTSCNAAFTANTDSSCVTHFVNASTGSNLSYNWYINGVSYGSTNPSVSLANGNYYALLFTYSGGTLCDSTSQNISITCGNSGTNTPCQASFYTYTDSSCVTHFVNTSTAGGNELWYINGMTYSTSTSPAVALANGSYYATLYSYTPAGGFCDSITQMFTVSCGSGTTTVGCQANSQFYIFADSLNAGNYFAYNLSWTSGAASYLWDFGDGTTSSQQYPFHQYAIPGQYIVCLTVTSTSGTTTCTDTYCDSSSVQRMAAGFQMSQVNVIPLSVTGIKQTEKQIGLIAFPNPIADELTIEATTINDNKLTFVLVDALGRLVLTGNLNNSKTTINTSNLEKGFYSLSVTNEKGSSLKTIKLVK
jgi:PKD repeat protein